MATEQVLVAHIRPYAPAALIAVLIFYFGVNALTGDRGLLTHARRDAVLSSRMREPQDLRRERSRLEMEVRLLSEPRISRDFLEERAQVTLGYSDPRDYVVRQND